MPFLYKIAVVIHVFSAVIWAGGVLFIALVGVPSLGKLAPDLKRQMLIEMGNRFRTVGWTCLTLLVITGSYMTYLWGATWSNLLDLSFFEHGHSRVLGRKLILVALMLVVSAVHDWWLGPRSARMEMSDEEKERARQLASYLGRITGLLVIGIVFLAVSVARRWI